MLVFFIVWIFFFVLKYTEEHRKAKIDEKKNFGISLRFPRFTRERSDKSVDDCSSAAQFLDEALATDFVKNSITL